jgi:hypothetical protein
MSTTASMTTWATWMPSGPSCLARDWARLRWVALAEPKATKPAARLSEAVAPDDDDAAGARLAHVRDGLAAGEQAAQGVHPPGALEGNGVGVVEVAEVPGGGVVDQDPHRTEIRADARERGLDLARLGGVAWVAPGAGYLGREVGEPGQVTRQQGDGMAGTGEAAGEGRPVAGAGADDHANGLGHRDPPL